MEKNGAYHQIDNQYHLPKFDKTKINRENREELKSLCGINKQ